MRECGDVLTGLRKTARESCLFQISGEGLYGGVRQMSGGGGEPGECVEELGPADEDPGMGGC